MGVLPKVANMSLLGHPVSLRTVQLGGTGIECGRSPRELTRHFPPSCHNESFPRRPAAPASLGDERKEMEGGSKKERIEAKFQGVCLAGRRILILLSQRIGGPA